MVLYVLDESLNKVGVIDNAISVIWSEHYYDPGEFEIYMPVSIDVLDLLKIDRYITRTDTDTIMIIEKIEIKSNLESGDRLAVSGRSLISLLDRRVMMQSSYCYIYPADRYSISDLIYKIITDGYGRSDVLNYEFVEYRYSDIFVDDYLQLLEYSGKDDEVEKLKLKDDKYIDVSGYLGDNCLEALTSTLKNYGVGLKFVYTFNNVTPVLRQHDTGKKTFFYYPYRGTDRSYKQTILPEVVFSKDNETVLSSVYVNDTKVLRNSAFIAGEGKEGTRKRLPTTDFSGFARREIYVDARDLQSISNDGTRIMSEEEYNKMLIQRGKDKLQEVSRGKTFEAEIDANSLYEYKKDYFLGDVVSVYNGYGVKTAPRIIEVTECEDENGYSITPTFSEWEIDE